MSLLTERAPTAVEIDGRSYAIRWSFRTGLRFARLLADETVPEAQKAALAYNLFYPVYPDNAAAGLAKILWFWGCGKVLQQGTEPKAGPAVFDYEWDADLIFAAFMADYGLDLESVEGLHWWKFCALFAALRPENLFCRVMEARGMDLSKVCGEQKNYYRRMKALYAMPKSCSEIAQEQMIVEALNGGGDVTQVLEKLAGGLNGPTTEQQTKDGDVCGL